MKNTDLDIFGKYGGLKISEHTNVQLKYKAMWTEFNALFKQIIDALQLGGIQVTEVKKGLWQNSGYFARYFWNRFYLSFQIKGTLLLYLNLSEHGLRAGIGLNDSSQTSLESEQSNTIYDAIVKAVKTAFIQTHFDVADYGNNAGVKPTGDLDAAVEDWVDIYKRLIQPYEQIYNQFYMQPNSLKREKMQSLNTILYGPPGTGKTFNTVDLAWQILNTNDSADTTRPGSIQELKSRYPGQVEFVTFHQSFSYEDFVEGIQAKTDGEKISYEVEDGVFKRICQNAKAGTTRNVDYLERLRKAVSLLASEVADKGGINLKTKSQNKPYKLVYYGNQSFYAIPSSSQSEVENPVSFQSLEKWYLNVGNRNIVDTKIPFKSYTVPVLDYLKAHYGVPDYSEQFESESKPYILIIDEINRGNISRIFGELITLIEPSKRAGNDEAIEVTLPYSKEPFSVPNNLYIIGTMNTADRSLALMDTALRRRFDFIEMMPNPCLLHKDLSEFNFSAKDWEKFDSWNFDKNDTSDWCWHKDYEGEDVLVADVINLRRLLFTMNQRIEALYDREHTLGHAFLMNVESLDDLRHAFKNKILPLLEEYFYDDWQKIRWVLGASADNFYVPQSFSHLFSGNDANIENKFLRNNLDDLDDEAFVAIYQS